MIKESTKAEFAEVSDPIDLCRLPFKPHEVEARYGIRFGTYEEDGLGPCDFCYVQIGAAQFFLHAYPCGPDLAAFVLVSVQSYTTNLEFALLQVLRGLNIARSDLLWEQTEIGPFRWALLRVDDNGNEFEIFRFPDLQRAECARRRFEGKGHKQFYTVRQI